MLKERQIAAQAVADNLFAVERAIDDAIARCVRLTVSIPVATAQVNLSAVVGQEAIACSASAFSALIQARQDIVAAHRELDATCAEIGLRGSSFGNSGQFPANELAVVEQVAA
jgi:hypothetical protein